METLLLNNTGEGLKTAASLIREGGIVGIPTETVYGLGADAANEDAVNRVFAAKGRPADNPLIVHIAEFSQAEELTESISVEMSEVNTNHPVVNAILNQEYKIAQGKGIGMIFSVTDADKIILSDEDIVVVLGNLIENAIHECEKVVDEGSNAAIIVKIANVNQKTVITVENPLHNDIIIENNQVVNKNSEGHGIGLDNVRESIERYDGSFAISAENNRFMAVVIV